MMDLKGLEHFKTELFRNDERRADLLTDAVVTLLKELVPGKIPQSVVNEVYQVVRFL